MADTPNPEPNQVPVPDRLLDLAQVLLLVPISRFTLWRLVRAQRFPAPKRISERRLAWLETDVRAWMKRGL